MEAIVKEFKKEQSIGHKLFLYLVSLYGIEVVLIKTDNINQYDTLKVFENTSYYSENNKTFYFTEN